MSIGDAIKEIMRVKNIPSVRKLSFITGVSNTYLGMLMDDSRKVISPSIDLLKQICSTTGYNFEMFLAKIGCINAPAPLESNPQLRHIATKKFPVIGEIACGQPLAVLPEEIELYIEAGTDIKADYVLRAKGDSMTGARIFDGDYVFIREQQEVNNGEIAAVAVESEDKSDSEITLKRVYFYPDKNKLVLKPENPSFEPLVFVGEELESVRIIGKAVAFQSDVR